MHATLTFSDVLPLPHGRVPGVSLLIYLCITSTSEASPDTVARPTTQPAWPLSSQQQTLFLSVSQHILYCVSVFSSFFKLFLFKRRAPCRVLLILQANALTINSISIEQGRALWERRQLHICSWKIVAHSALTDYNYSFMCFREIMLCSKPYYPK